MLCLYCSEDLPAQKGTCKVCKGTKEASLEGLLDFIFKDKDAQQKWLGKPRQCWYGLTPNQLINEGKEDAVVRWLEHLLVGEGSPDG